jgi:hypothetical protein
VHVAHAHGTQDEVDKFVKTSEVRSLQVLKQMRLQATAKRQFGLTLPHVVRKHIPEQGCSIGKSPVAESPLLVVLTSAWNPQA